MTVRLHKFLADAGVASRRASERIILDGRVEVNGEPVRQLGAKVDPLHDRVTVDGRAVHARRKLYIALHKPRGCVCSRKDELNRPTIYAATYFGRQGTEMPAWSKVLSDQEIANVSEFVFQAFIESGQKAAAKAE